MSQFSFRLSMLIVACSVAYFLGHVAAAFITEWRLDLIP